MPKNNIAPNANIKDQNDNLTSQKMLKSFGDLCDNLTRQFNNAMEYRSDPIHVIPAKDVEKAIVVRTQFPKEYQDCIVDIKAAVNENKNVLRNISSHYNSMAASYNKLSGGKDELERTVSKLQQDKRELEAQIENLNTDALDRFIRNVKRRFKEWFTWRTLLYGIIACYAALLVMLFVVNLQTSYLSTDALSRRAYNAAVQLNWKNPGMYYQEIRRECKVNGRKSGKKLVEYYESLADGKKKETEQ